MISDFDKTYLQLALGIGRRILGHVDACTGPPQLCRDAVEITFPAVAAHEWNQTVMLPAAGIAPDETAAGRAGIEEAVHALRYPTANAAILFHKGELGRQATIGSKEELSDVILPL